MLIKRAPLFFCLVLGGLLLDAYWTWYWFQYAAACSASGMWVPPFTAVSLIPATVSLIFRNNRACVFICLVVWLAHVAHQVWLLTEAPTINCHRHLGFGEETSLYYAVVFSAAIIAITLAFGAIWLVRKWLHRLAVP